MLPKVVFTAYHAVSPTQGGGEVYDAVTTGEAIKFIINESEGV